MTAFFTFAYNASKTIRRTIDSVLNQTCDDLVYYIIDDGSDADDTRNIIAEYAAYDNRIIPIYMDFNDPYEASRIGFSKIFNSNAEYFCMIDADDEYFPNYLSEMLDFMSDNNLDIAAVGSYFIDSKSNEVIGTRALPTSLFLSDSNSYNKYFSYVHVFMRTIWGKVFKTSIFKNFNTLDDNWEYYKVVYGGDTVFVMDAMRHSKKFGVLNKILHKYYCSNKSASYSWTPTRPCCDISLYKYAISFLEDKAGYVSSTNMEFINAVFINATKDTVKVLLNAELKASLKLEILCEIFSVEPALTIISKEDDGKFKYKDSTFLKNLFKVINSYNISKKDKNGIWLGMTFSSILGYEEHYVEYSVSNISFLINNYLIKEAEKELIDWETVIPNDARIIKLRRKLEMVKNH